MPDRVRVLIVDDSALMRKLLADLLRSEPGVEVVGAARDGFEAIAMAGRLKPDVVTLDVEMPGLSGLEALPALLDAHECPVVMVSALTQEGADVTLAALEMGAVDFLPKPDRYQLAAIRGARDLLVAKVLAASQSRVVRPRRRVARPTPCNAPAPATATASAPEDTDPTAEPDDASRPLTCVVIGISTGGPLALSQVFQDLVPPVPPILVVQHMPARFTAAFAERLDRVSRVSIKEAEEGDRVRPNRIHIAPGGRHMTVIGNPSSARATLCEGPAVSGHRPSVDVLFRSAAATFRSGTVGIIMTGMGRDGVEGCRAILAVSGHTFGQDEATSVVYGMNKAAYLEGVVGAQFALDELPAIIRGLPVFADPSGIGPRGCD
jgi:two-component system chemotaxis response regulator CheB